MLLLLLYFICVFIGLELTSEVEFYRILFCIVKVKFLQLRFFEFLDQGILIFYENNANVLEDFFQCFLSRNLFGLHKR